MINLQPTFSPSLALALSFMVSATISIILVPIVSRFATVHGLFDASSPRRQLEAHRKVHVGSIPRLGGVAMVLAFLTAISIFQSSIPHQGVIVGSLIIFICGAIDDFVPLNAKIRLGVQFIAATFAVSIDHLSLDQLVFTNQISFALSPVVSYPLSVFIIVGAINSINLIDGLDGLAAGVVLIGIGLLAFASFVNSQNPELVLVFAVPIIGSIFGFLRYNTHPATIFMGDGGSNWLGFMSGSLLLIAMRGSSEAGTALPFVSALLTFSIPIIDTATVILKRLREKRSPFSADKNHFHHTLLRVGLTHSQSVTTIYFLAFACGILGIFPAIFPKYNLPWIPYSVGIALLFVIPASTKLDDDAISEALSTQKKLQRNPMSLLVSTLITYWENANRYLMFAILILGPALSGKVPKEFATWSVSAILIVIASAFIPNSKRGAVFFDSFAISVASVVILVVNNLNPMTIAWEGRTVPIHGLYNSLFIVLFLSSTLLFLLTARRRSLIFTPSDFLLLTIPLAILLLPKDWQSQYKLDLISLRCLVIFMSMRVLYRRRPKKIGNLKFACLAALIWVYLVAQHGVKIVY